MKADRGTFFMNVQLREHYLSRTCLYKVVRSTFEKKEDLKDMLWVPQTIYVNTKTRKT